MPTCARPRPVLPAVASMMVPPGFRVPSRSAASIMERAMRSLIEPPGFWLSSLMNSRHLPVSNFFSSTMGVSPIRSSTDEKGGFSRFDPACGLVPALAFIENLLACGGRLDRRPACALIAEPAPCCRRKNFSFNPRNRNEILILGGYGPYFRKPVSAYMAWDVLPLTDMGRLRLRESGLRQVPGASEDIYATAAPTISG